MSSGDFNSNFQKPINYLSDIKEFYIKIFNKIISSL